MSYNPLEIIRTKVAKLMTTLSNYKLNSAIIELLAVYNTSIPTKMTMG